MIAVILIGILAVFFAYNARFSFGRHGLEFAFVIITIFLAIRYDFGNDYMAYLDTFDRITNMNMNIFSLDAFNLEGERVEGGWILLNYLCKPIGFFGLVILTTIFECYIIYKLIKEHVPCKWWWFAVFIFVFSPNLMLTGASMMRQFLAMTICIYSITFIINKKPLKFGLLIFVACFFHSSAIIFSIMYILKFIPIIKRDNSLLLIIAFSIWTTICVLSFSAIESFLTHGVLKQYAVYLGKGEVSIGLGVLFNAVLLLIVMSYIHKHDQYNRLISYAAMMNLFMLPLLFLTTMFGRLTIYFEIFCIVYYPISFQFIRNEFVKYMIVMMYIVFIIYIFHSFFHSEVWIDKFMTYQTIFTTSWK